MKKILFILLVFIGLDSYAEDQKLHVILKTGNHASIPIADQPKIVFENGVMSVGSEYFLVNNVVKYLIGNDDVLGIHSVESNELHIDANDAINGKVTIENYGGQSIKVYSTNGVEVPCEVSISDTTAKIDYSALPAGIYLLSVGKETIKIQKR